MIAQEHDLKNGRVWSMWSEAGMQFRSNIMTRIGAVIPLHVHDYDHVAIIGAGKLSVTEITRSGEALAYEVAAAALRLNLPSLITIPAFHQHTFELVAGDIGEVLCIWPSLKA